MKTGRDLVIQLLVDDNVPSRVNWKNIFLAEFNFMGNFSGQHK